MANKTTSTQIGVGNSEIISVAPQKAPRNIKRIVGSISVFMINLIALVGSVIIASFGDHWFDSWLPEGGYGAQWYQYAATQHDIGLLLSNTLIVAISTTFLALLIGFPSAYVLARKKFRFKGVLMGIYMIPMLVPPLAYGIPLATMLLRNLGNLDFLPSTIMLIIINLVPVLPFVIMILVPFIEQIDTSLESASHMLGANQFQTFIRILLPLVVPGILTAGVLSIVRSMSMFDLTYLVADSNSQTLVLALYGDASASGSTPTQAIDALSVIYMLTTMSLLVIALLFVKPTQFVVQVKASNNK
jgi:putative spermidine/putrescine transport system permease protein